MTISVSTDQICPAERQAFWTESICRSFAHVDTRPIGTTLLSGHFELVEIGNVKLVRFDSSPQCYRRDAKLVSKAGSDEFMFDFQRRGRSSMVQAGNEGMIEPGFGVLYDARRPFEDRLDGPGRSEVLIATVPAAALLRMFPQAGRLCAKPVPLAGTIARSIAGFIRAAIDRSDTRPGRYEADIAAYLATLLRLASGDDHELTRAELFGLIETHLRANLEAIRPAQTLAAEFRVSERTFHRIFADHATTFERHVLQLRVERFRNLLQDPALSAVSIAALAMQCGFADAAHATRTFRRCFDVTPRDFRGGIAAHPAQIG